MTQENKEIAAVRKFVWALAYPDEEERREAHDSGEDVFGAVNKALGRVAALEEENERLREELEETKATAKTAYSVAGQTADQTRADGGPNKTRIAERLSRNEVVRQALTTSGKGGSVTGRDVVDMAKPQTRLYHRIVRNAWENLVAEWDSLRIQEPDDRDNRLVVDRDELEDELVRVVDEDLSDENLTERFIGGRS